MRNRSLLSLARRQPSKGTEGLPLENGWTIEALDLLKRRFFEQEDGSISEWAWNVTKVFTKRYQGEEQKTWHERYFALLYSRKFFPTSAALKNGRRSGPLSGCTVLPLSSSLSKLFSETMPKALKALSSGIGVGLDLSPLLPKLSPDQENFRPSPGPVEVMIGIAQLSSSIIKYNGLKRAAFMASLRYDHPDIFEFIKMKSDRPLDVANISIAIDSDFSEALVKNGYFPVKVNGKSFLTSDLEQALINSTKQNVLPADLSLLGDGRIASRSLNGRIVGREIDGQIHLQAARVLEAAAETAHTCGDPGLINLSAINAHNPTAVAQALAEAEKPGLGIIQTTTPCGEQPLLPHEVCHLGSLNLSAFIQDNEINWESLAESVKLAVRVMDDIVDQADNGSEASNAACLANRKIGIGIMGLADVLCAKELPYDSEVARVFAQNLVKFINDSALAASIDLAAQRGPFPNWQLSKFADGAPRRHATVTTIAPTGHISILAGCSTGIEPYFSLHHTRKAAGERTEVCRPLEKYLEKLDYSLDRWILATKNEKHNDVFDGSLENLSDHPTDSDSKNTALRKAKHIFRTALQISGMDHLQMIAALQLCVENGISKTINLPSSASVQEVYQIFMDAIRLSLKGITVFRDGSLSEQALTVSAGCAGCGAVMALRRNECGGYVCATERGGCGFAVCEV
jgi:ribonucleoside-diphosphate reductase alpha chain